MPTNLLKKYPELLEIGFLSEQQRKVSLRNVFERDIEDNSHFNFRTKQIRPIKKDGEASMQTLFHHLTTQYIKDENGKKTGDKKFDIERSKRLHWIRYHIEEIKKTQMVVFSYEDRVKGKDVIRTYIYDIEQEYVIILEPQRSKLDYYLLTAYYLNEPGGKKQIVKKQKRKLNELY